MAFTVYIPLGYAIGIGGRKGEGVFLYSVARAVLKIYLEVVSFSQVSERM